MASLRIRTARLTKSAIVAAINASPSTSRSLSRYRFSTVVRASDILSSATGFTTRPEIAANDVRSLFHGGFVPHNRSLLFSTPRRYSTAVDSSLYNPQGYTEMAWEGIVGATDAAQRNKQQIIESEHLMKALLEQKRWISKKDTNKGWVRQHISFTSYR